MTSKTTRRLTQGLTSSLASGTSILALATIASTFSGKAHAQACVEDLAMTGAFTCSGAQTVRQSVNGGAGAAAVTTDGTFSVNTATGDALDITATGDVSYIDDNASDLTTGRGIGLDIQSTGTGNVTVETGGAITGTGDGIDAVNAAGLTAGDISVTTGAGAISGGTRGIDLRARGSGNGTVITGTGAINGGNDGIRGGVDDGALTITVDTATVTSQNQDGIQADAFGAGSADVTTGSGAISGLLDGIDARTETGDLTVVTGDGAVTGTESEGIIARSLDGGSVTVEIGAGDVTGGAEGIQTNTRDTGATDVSVGAANILGGTQGIRSDARNDSTISITTTTGTVTGGDTDANSDGIDARSRRGDTEITVGSGDVTGGNGHGIDARANQGAVTVTVGTASVTGGATDGDWTGIEALTTTGAISVTTNGAVSGSEFGINATTDSGEITIETGDGDISGDDEHAVYAMSETGPITITTGAGAVSGKGETTIIAKSMYSGDISVVTGSGDITSTNGGGVYVYAYDEDDDGASGNVTITTGEGDITAENGWGVYGNATAGAVSVTIGAGNVSSDDAAVSAWSYGEGNEASIVTQGGSVYSASDEGLYGYAEAGTVTITTGAGDIGSGSDTAILGTAISGEVTIVTGDGAVTSASTDDDVAAIYGRNEDGSAISITTGTGAVEGAETGIIAATNSDGTPETAPGNGPVTIEVNGVVAGGGTGIILLATNEDSEFAGKPVIPVPQPVQTLRTPAALEAFDAPRVVTINAGASVSGGTVGIDDRDTVTEVAIITLGAPTTTNRTYGGVSSDITVAGDLEGGALLNAGDDRFTLVAGGTVSGTVDGGGGTAAPLDVTNAPTPTGPEGADTFTDQFVLGGDSLGAGIDGTIDLSGADLDGDGAGADPAADLVILRFEEFHKIGTSTFELTGDNTETGDGAILMQHEGGIVVSGSLGGLALDALADTTLAGAGTIGAVSTQGSIAPGAVTAAGGSTVGTLTVDGDLSLGATASLDAQLGAAGNDLVDVSGAATIDGGATVTASLELVTTAVPDQTRFTILTADGGVTGAFGTVNEEIPDIALTAEYEDNAVILVASVGVPGVQPPAFGAPVDQDQQQVLSEKELAASTGQAAVFDMRTVAESLRSFVTETAAVEGASGLSTRGGTGALHFGFGSGFGSATDVESDGAALGFDASTRGVLGGVGGVIQTDTAIGALTYGVALFAQETDVDTAAGSADTDSIGIGIFGGFDIGAWSIDTGVAFASLDFDFTRNVAAGVVATGETDGEAAILSFEASYDLGPVGPGGLILQPYLGLDYVHVGYDSYTETGAGLLNLAVASDDLNVGFARAGLRAETGAVAMGAGHLSSNLALGVEHAFGDVDPVVSSVLAALPGATFTDAAAGIDETRATIGVGLAYTQGNLTTHIRYDGSFSGRTESHRASIGVDFRF